MLLSIKMGLVIGSYHEGVDVYKVLITSLAKQSGIVSSGAWNLLPASNGSFFPFIGEVVVYLFLYDIVVCQGLNSLEKV